MAIDFILYILYLYNIYNISIFVKIAYFMCVSFSRSTFLPFYPFHLFAPETDFFQEKRRMFVRSLNKLSYFC